MAVKSFINLNWKSVPLEHIHAVNSDFEGLIAIEECSDYSVDVGRYKKVGGNSRDQSTTKSNKRKLSLKYTNEDISDVTKKVRKVKNTSVTNNGFVVEEDRNESEEKTVMPLKKKCKDSKRQRMKKKMKLKLLRNKDLLLPNVLEKKHSTHNSNSNKLKRISLGESVSVSLPCTNEDESLDNMDAWTNMGIPNKILNALSDQGFREPTEIQRLTLPPAILGRRDILGAAETGSGKTIAFGIPIINGILQIKEKVTSGVDYDQAIFKKSTNKKSMDRSIENIYDDEQSHVKMIKKCTQKSKLKIHQNGNKRKQIVDSNSSLNEDEAECEEDDEDADSDSDNENKDHVSGMYNSGDNSDNSFDSESESNIVTNNENLDENGFGCVKVIDDVELNTAITESSTRKPLYALILTPTRELAIQIKNHLVALTKYTDIRVAVIFGGMAHVKQERVLSKYPEIVVATPGRLWELIQLGNDHLSQIDNIRFLTIDETDRMLERGHFEELQSLLERINADKEKRLARQNFVFSATLTLVHDLPDHAWRKKVTKNGKIIGRKVEKITPQKKLKKLIEMLGITNPKIVDVTTSNQGKANTLVECRISCPIDYKDYYLYYILKRHPGRTIVFCNSIGCVKRLAQLFNLLQCSPLPLHANMQQRQRLKNLERFRDNPLGVLISTDVAARGLDIPNIDHVIHYQVPRTAENYIHRSGRTARATKEGITILMMEPGEGTNYTKLCRTLGKREDLPMFPVPDALLLATKERVNLARDLDKFELRNKKFNTETGWLQKAIKEMDIIVDDDEMPIKVREDCVSKNVLNNTRKRLNALLSKPLFAKGFSFKYPSTNDPKAVHSFDSDAGKNNALNVMKSALQTGLVKKLKKRSKNEEFLNMSRKLSIIK